MNNPMSSTGKDLEKDVAAGARNVAAKAEEVKETASEKFKEYKESAKEMLHEANNTTMADVEKKVGKCITNNPGNSLLAAAVVGFAAAFLIWRR